VTHRAHTMDKAQFDRIVGLLAPLMDKAADRLAIVRQALFGCEVLPFIDWEGGEFAFTVNLLHKLVEFGEWPKGKPAVVSLLEGLRDKVGVTKQAEIDLLIAALMPKAPDKPFVFISYARADGAAQAEHLYTDLRRRGFDAWRDTRDLDPYAGFDAEIETALEQATHVAILVTPDVKRENTFVRLEIAYALAHNKPLIPLLFPGGHRPITIINHTFIPFADWDAGFAQLLERLKRGSTEPLTPETRRERELAYLQRIAEQYERWLYLYTDLAGQAERKRDKPKVAVKSHALKYVNVENEVYRERGFIESGEMERVPVRDLREVVREGGIVLIGEPGSGKTVTLQRLAYEFAVAAVEDASAPLPLFVPLGSYRGGGAVEEEAPSEASSMPLHTYDGRPFEEHLAAYFGSLNPADYLPSRLILLLDGLNEMPRHQVEAVDAWLRAHRDVRAVVTCRRLDYAALKALPLRRVDVAPLDVGRIRLFIGNYLEDDDRDRLFWALAGDDMRNMWALWQAANLTFEDFWGGDDVKDKAHPVYNASNDKLDAQYNAMRTAMREKNALPGLLGLLTNPFLLNISVEVFIASGQPPRNRGQLFAAFVDLLIEKRGRPAVPEAEWIDAPTQKAALAKLAYQMQVEGMGTSVPTAWARAALGANGDRLLYLAQAATLLTVDPVNDEVKFFHQLLQEYGAAVELGAALRRGASAAEYWLEGWATPSGWEETAVLLAGIFAPSEGGAARVADWLVEIHPIIACRALLESEAQPPKATVERVQMALVAAMTGDAPPIARAAAGRIINRLGDPRQGTGLKQDRLPDIDWVHIPAGELVYGEGDDKKILHLSRFFISRYLITNVQFAAFVNAIDGYVNPAWWTVAGLEWKGEQTIPEEYGDADFRLPNHPRVYITWYEAIAFCRWLSDKLKRVITLPTEQQFERVARGTAGNEYPWGSEYREDCANIDTSWDDEKNYVGQPTAVGIYPRGTSVEGVYDLSGNVWEWCLNEYYRPENVQAEGAKTRVLRGGAWDYDRQLARATYRLNRVPNLRTSNFGFRVVWV
jgi:formylglycine-generating enzyme required for sulfatase activity